MEFKASYLEIEPHELVHYLLRESGQQGRDAINPPDILDLLRLQHVTFDFEVELPHEIREEGVLPRALLCFDERLVATDRRLRGRRARFSVLHEIAHYVLPNHQHALYVCDDRGMRPWTRLRFEREANEFAAGLLFHGDRFTLETNSHVISAATVKLLAEKYRASYEATARRFVERSFRPCMLIIFEKKDRRAQISVDIEAVWTKKYTVASAPFKAAYFADIRSAVVSAETVAVVTAPGRDVGEGYRCNVTVRDQAGDRRLFDGEFFYNRHNVFCFLTSPKK
jgi:Zn-dependent peptidase ImmA (M78 family)